MYFRGLVSQHSTLHTANTGRSNITLNSDQSTDREQTMIGRLQRRVQKQEWEETAKRDGLQKSKWHQMLRCSHCPYTVARVPTCGASWGKRWELHYNICFPVVGPGCSFYWRRKQRRQITQQCVNKDTACHQTRKAWHVLGAAEDGCKSARLFVVSANTEGGTTYWAVASSAPVQNHVYMVLFSPLT